MLALVSRGVLAITLYPMRLTCPLVLIFGCTLQPSWTRAGSQAVYDVRVAPTRVLLSVPGVCGGHLISESRCLSLSVLHRKPVRWYIMTSRSTHQATTSFFKDHGHLGLQASQLFFFQQVSP